MNGLLAFFVAVLVFQVTSASDNHQMTWLRGMKTQMQEITNEVSTAIQNAQIDSAMGKRAMMSQANEWVLKIQKATHALERTILHNQEGPNQQEMKQMTMRLSDMTHMVRQVMNADAAQLKNKLKTCVQDVLSENDKLVDIAEQHLQKKEQNQENAWEELKDVIERLVNANRQMRNRAQLMGKNQQEMKDRMQRVLRELMDTIDKMNANDQATALELSHQAHMLSHCIERICNCLLKDAHNMLDDQSKVAVRQIANKMMEMRAHLDRAANSEGKTNPQAWMREMKDQLKTCCNMMMNQMEQLMQLMRSGNESKDIQNLNTMVRSVVAKTMSEARRLQWQLENIKRD